MTEALEGERPVDWELWRPVFAGIGSKREVWEAWTMDDLVDAHDALDAKEAAEAAIAAVARRLAAQQ